MPQPPEEESVVRRLVRSHGSASYPLRFGENSAIVSNRRRLSRLRGRRQRVESAELYRLSCGKIPFSCCPHSCSPALLSFRISRMRRSGCVDPLVVSQKRLRLRRRFLPSNRKLLVSQVGQSVPPVDSVSDLGRAVRTSLRVN